MPTFPQRYPFRNSVNSRRNAGAIFTVPSLCSQYQGESSSAFFLFIVFAICSISKNFSRETGGSPKNDPTLLNDSNPSIISIPLSPRTRRIAFRICVRDGIDSVSGNNFEKSNLLSLYIHLVHTVSDRGKSKRAPAMK